jgi:hypothetical protein
MIATVLGAAPVASMVALLPPDWSKATMLAFGTGGRPVPLSGTMAVTAPGRGARMRAWP